MEQLQRWLEAQFAERRTEPNSGLGKAITYLLRYSAIFQPCPVDTMPLVNTPVRLHRSQACRREPRRGVEAAGPTGHWRPLTLFLRQAGAPLDNNIVERALKRAVLHRKNALFYRTLNGAEVGDLFMGLIHTCQLCGANSFDYLSELQRHAQKLAANPAEWMPWNYRETLDRIVSLSDSP
jgi:hypothetical protein